MPLLFLMLAFLAGTDDLRLNQIQVIGTHNSYHLAPLPVVRALIAAANPKAAESLDYTHRPLAEQFGELGIRQIELDVFHDPEGGLYAQPLARARLIEQGQDPGAELPDAMRKPGMKVFHVQDIDQRSSAPTLIDALKQVRQWSQEHPKHVPILVLLELKDETHPGLSRPAAFDKPALETLEAEILSVFERNHLLTPDDVRGDAKTLPEAIAERGWPRLDDVRGRVMFGLDNEDRIRDEYLDGHPALRGRLLFATVAEDNPAAAWFKINNPVRDFDRIQRLVKAGYLVRTRADASTKQSRGNDPSQRDKALASGAQFVSTDYPEPDRRFSDYQVKLPGDVVARVNPISGPKPVNVEDAETR